MKVLLVNGSPNEKRCTYTALSEVAGALEAQGVDTEIAWIGRDPVRGCLGCGGCSKRGDNRCIFDDDVANGLIEKAVEADGLVVGTPVFYAGANGALLAVLDRLFYAASARLRFKPAAAVASARRAGTTPAIDQINKYFQINCMPVVSSNYWPHGARPKRRRRTAGCRGSADHACAWHEHGLDAAGDVRCACAERRAEDHDELHPLA